MMKKNLIIIALLYSYSVVAQNEEFVGERITRLNIINPGVEYEMPLYKNIVMSACLGVGYGGSYPELDESVGNGFVYVIAPYLDVQLKHLYSVHKRIRKGKNVSGNSGNYWGVRFMARGNSIRANIKRSNNRDYMVCPTWGIQRAYGAVHLLFDVGLPMYYWDGNGKDGVFPLMLQLNVGINLSKIKF